MEIEHSDEEITTELNVEDTKFFYKLVSKLDVLKQELENIVIDLFSCDESYFSFLYSTYYELLNCEFKEELEEDRIDYLHEYYFGPIEILIERICVFLYTNDLL